MSSLYAHSIFPAAPVSPRTCNQEDIDSQYLAQLLSEHQKLGPFMQVFPICSHLLNKEILRVSGMVSSRGFDDCNMIQQRSPSPMANSNSICNVGVTGIGILSASLREFNFVGRLLGPRGNSLKRIEASTGCRVYIRGKGSIKDSYQEEKMRGRAGYEHLNDPLHILIEAELPANTIDARLRHAQEIIEELLRPVDESQDHYKKQQLQELALLNSGSKEDSPHPSGSASPFYNGMKRAKAAGW